MPAGPTRPVNPEMLQQVVSALAQLVRQHVPSLLPVSVRTYIPLSASALDREITWLALAAAKHAVADALSSWGPLLPIVEKDLINQVAGAEVATATQRLREYQAAMSIMRSNDALFEVPLGAEGLPYNGNPAHDIGLVFAFLVGATREPLVPPGGALVFGTTLTTAREMLSTAFGPPHG